MGTGGQIRLAETALGLLKTAARSLDGARRGVRGAFATLFADDRAKRTRWPPPAAFLPDAAAAAAAR